MTALEGTAGWHLPVLAGLFLLLAAAEGLRPGAAGVAEAASRWGVNIGCWLLGAWAVAWLPENWAGGLAGGQPFAWLNAAAGPGVALAAGLLGLDLFTYGAHRLFHTAPLWPIHAVHHADLRVDASTALRHHPFEAVGMALLGGALFALLGLPGWLLALYGVMALAWQFTQHAELPWPAWLERLLRPVLMTAGLHRTHHSADARHQGANFGTVLSVWDRLFGTYCPAPDETLAYGIGVPEAERPQAALLLPFWLGRR